MAEEEKGPRMKAASKPNMGFMVIMTVNCEWVSSCYLDTARGGVNFSGCESGQI